MYVTIQVGGLLPRLSILTLAGGFFLLHFPDAHAWLTLSAILPCEARTFLTVIPFGNIPRGRLTRLLLHYSTVGFFCQDKVCFFTTGRRDTMAAAMAVMIISGIM